MATVTFEQARECVISKVSEARSTPASEELRLFDAAGRVLAEDVAADRDYPPLARSVRDGFAVRAVDLPGEFFIVGEVRAGDIFTGEVQPGQAVEIMTGAPLPRGADCVVMVEQCRVTGEKVATDTILDIGANVNPRAAEATAGETVLEAGKRLGYADIALLATVGRHHVWVYRQPQVAIIATGDEIVDVGDQPLEFQIRNSNSESLAVQVARAGGFPVVLPVARDEYKSTRRIIEQGLEYDMLLLSGGVSAGKFDIVERVLSDLGAEFYFDRVLIQPGQPLVFGRAQGKFIFGLPGNPGSTMVTFELFARAALELLSGQRESALPLLWSKLGSDFRARPGLRRFLPASLSSDGGSVMPLKWAGSGDVTALSRANAFVVTEPERESWTAGDLIRVLQK
ncbi:MAG: gephyrin-like molybdotransferase Glp [Bryobacteraceae bacterium]